MNARNLGTAVLCLCSLGLAPWATAGAAAVPRPGRMVAPAAAWTAASGDAAHLRPQIRDGRSRHPLFAGPSDLVLGAHHDVLVADQLSKSIITLSPQGKVLARWKHAGDKPSQFTQLYGIARDRGGNIYVSDAVNHVIDKLSPTGRPLAQWDTGLIIAGSFPTLLTVASNGDIYVSDHAARAVLQLSPSGALISKIGAGAIGDPYGVTIAPDGNLYVTDFGASRVREFTPDGTPLVTWGGTEGAVQIQNPEAIAVDAHGAIYVSEQIGQIVKFDSSGKVLADWHSRGARTLDDASGLALDRQGNIYVAEYMGRRVDKLSPTGRVLAVWH